MNNNKNYGPYTAASAVAMVGALRFGLPAGTLALSPWSWCAR